MIDDTQKVIQEAFAELPEAVQNAIADASVEKKLRALSEKYKLHLDQWVLLENEIMLTLLGLKNPEQMASNISKEVGIEQELAQQIVNDIAVQVFRPIREQLQGTVRKEGERRETVEVPIMGSKPNEEEKERKKKAMDTLLNKNPIKKAPVDSLAYKPGQNSAERKDVQEDPYRESIE